MKSFSDFKGIPDAKKAEFIRSIPDKNFIAFLEQKTDEKTNPSLVQLCFLELGLQNACFEKLSRLAKAAKQQNDEVTIQSLNRLMVLQNDQGYAGWHYLSAYNKFEEAQLLLAIADVKSFNASMASQNLDGTGWLMLAYYQHKSAEYVKMFMGLADATLFNQAMISHVKQGWTGWHVAVRNQNLRECLEIFINRADIRLFNQCMTTANAAGKTGWMLAARCQKYECLSYLINKLYDLDINPSKIEELEAILLRNPFLSADRKALLIQQIKLRISIFKDPIGFLQEASRDFVKTIKGYVDVTRDLEGMKRLESALDDCMKKLNQERNSIHSKLDAKLENAEQRQRLLENARAKLQRYKQQLMINKGLMHLRKFNDVNNATARKTAFLTEDFLEASKCFLEYGAGANSFDAHREIGFALVDGLGSFITPAENVVAPFPGENLLLALALASSSYGVLMTGLTHFQQAMDLRWFAQPVLNLKDVKDEKSPSPIALDQQHDDLPNENWMVMYKACLGVPAEEKMTAEQIKQKCDETIKFLAKKEAKLPAEWQLLADILKTIPSKLEPADRKFLVAFAAEKFRFEMSENANERNTHQNNMRSLVMDFINVKNSKGFGITWFQSGIPVEKLEDLLKTLDEIISSRPNLLHEKSGAKLT